MSEQPCILAPLPARSRYLQFQLAPGADATAGLKRLVQAASLEALVVGLGPCLIHAVGANVPGLRESPALSGPGVSVPSTPVALWLWLRGDDAGKLLHHGRELTRQLGGVFALESTWDGFYFDGGRDLTGYEDGTENPTGAKAEAAALVSSGGGGMHGSSFVAVQRWQHDLDQFAAMSQLEQDHSIGRRRSDNVELEDAPASAHVKRTAQESFDPEAFVVRRSVPWVRGADAGLMFVAFGKSFDAFEALLRRMLGLEADGITDALFRFTRPISSSYLWCPPCVDGRLDVSALGL